MSARAFGVAPDKLREGFKVPGHTALTPSAMQKVIVKQMKGRIHENNDL